jgi:nucleotide-binding universal stress UspA family protein
MFEHILVPFDFGKASERALDVAIDLAKAHGSRLTLLHVCEIPAYGYAGELSAMDLLTPIIEAAEKRFRELLRGTQARCPGAEGAFKVGFASEEILAAVRDRACALVVMGTHGRRGIAHAVLGSVAEKVVRMSTVPVLTVRSSES